MFNEKERMDVSNSHSVQKQLIAGTKQNER